MDGYFLFVLSGERGACGCKWGHGWSGSGCDWFASRAVSTARSLLEADLSRTALRRRSHRLRRQPNFCPSVSSATHPSFLGSRVHLSSVLYKATRTPPQPDVALAAAPQRTSNRSGIALPPLSSGFLLVLLPASVDRDFIAHLHLYPSTSALDNDIFQTVDAQFSEPSSACT